MLSVVICSKNPALLTQVSESIRRSVGVEYEIVVVDNYDGRYGICAAYNLGASQSRYPLLCFMHEDVLCHTDRWGEHVAEALADPTVGLVGVVGGTYMAKSPSGYWISGFRTNRIHQYQREPDGRLEFIDINPHDEPFAEVVAVDGLWMCCRREVWQQCPFDSVAFPGFHLYDLDISFGVRALGLKACVVYNVLFEHLSYGSYNREWVQAQLVFREKWQAALPASSEPLSAPERDEAELRCAQSFAHSLLSLGFPRTTAIPYVVRCLRLRPLDRGNAWIVRQVVLGRSLDAGVKRLLRRGPVPGLR